MSPATQPGPTVVVAPNTFKGSLTAVAAADALAEGVRMTRPDARVLRVPVADGGDGTVDAALSRGFEPVGVTVLGPTGQPVAATYARRGDVAVVELAGTCGLQQFADGVLRPMASSTVGLGQALLHAVRAGARDLVLALGGSASTDGGAGMLQALGARLEDASGAPLEPGGGALGSLARVDLAPLRPLLAGVRVRVASDVDSPLLGPHGAAAVFAPQKGATDEDVRVLEAGLARWAAAVTRAVGVDHSDQPGAGAAGGTGFAALAALDAEVHAGIDLVLDMLRFDESLAGAALVVTGEGSLDLQSLAGKAPVGVANAARAAGVAVVAVAGRCDLSGEVLREHGFEAVYSLADIEPDVRRSMTEAPALLRRVGARIAAEHLVADSARPPSTC